MSSAICFNLDQPKILLSGNELIKWKTMSEKEKILFTTKFSFVRWLRSLIPSTPHPPPHPLQKKKSGQKSCLNAPSTFFQTANVRPLSFSSFFTLFLKVLLAPLAKASELMSWPVVRLASVRPCVNFFLKHLLLWNYLSDFDEISQKYSCHGPLQNFLN